MLPTSSTSSYPSLEASFRFYQHSASVVMEIKVNRFTINIRPFHGWRSFSRHGIGYHIAGTSGQHFKAIAEEIQKSHPCFSQIATLLRNEKSVFSYIISSKKCVLASVDRIKSYPLFYGVDKNQQLHISNCANTVQTAGHLIKTDPNALLEFSMTGYTLGSSTLYQGLYQLQAGEYCLYHPSDKCLMIQRYYRYLPQEKTTASRETLIEEKAAQVDHVIQGLIEKANGRPIRLFLSGGLDSRLLLAQLAEKQYDDLQAISYGVPGNFEAKMAEHVAKQLNIPWQFIPAQPKQAKQLRRTQEHADYAKFASGLHTVPSYLEYETLHYLTHQKKLPENTLIVNGQSGDFITGGHLPRLIMNRQKASLDDLIENIIKKHASLWHTLVNPSNIASLRDTILSSLPHLAKTNTVATLCAQYESWEWQERQCKAVIKGQRLYDFFEYDWALPLWEPTLMDFWSKVPLQWRIHQNLYIEYLQRYYPKLFQTLRPIAKPWIRQFQWIPVIAHLYGVLTNKTKKQDYYKRMYYYGTDYNQYALMSRKYYLAHYRQTRGVVSFLVSLYLEDLGLLKDSPIAHAQSI